MGMFSSLFGDGGAAKRAAGVAAAGQKASQQMVQDQYNTTKATYQPYMDAGTGALGSYQGLAGALPGQVNPILGQMGNTVNSMNPIIGKLTSNNLNDYQQSPGYDFRMQQGEKALQNSAAANGTLFSGATGKALTEYGQNFGTNEYQNYLSNLQNQLTAVNTQLGAQGNQLNSTINANNAEMQPYANLMTQGSGMTQNLGQLGANAASTAAGYNSGAAASTAAGMQAEANSLQNAGNSWINMGAMAAGGVLGGAGMLGGMTAGQGMMAGGAIAGGATGNQMLPYQGVGNQPAYQQYNQPQQNQQIPVNGLPWQNQPQAYIQPQQQQQAMNNANMYKPTQSMSGSNPWSI